MYLQDCPRCGENAYEKLKTYAHCIDCNYFELYEDISPREKRKPAASSPHPATEVKNAKPEKQVSDDEGETKRIVIFLPDHSINVA